jgi:uncharacterized protein (TIGR02599 family)
MHKMIVSATPRRLRRGFTLVEVLVSLAVLAVLLTIIAQVLGQVQRVWSTANSRVAQFREARRAMERIVSNLSQATMNTYLAYHYGPAASPNNPLVPASTLLNTGPVGYVRYSELQFLSGQSSNLLGLPADESPGHAVFFQAPLGGALDANAGNGVFVNLPTALSACGYFLQFGDDTAFRPSFLNGKNHPPRRRYRLMEYRPPIEANVIYPDLAVAVAAPGVPNPQWYNQVGRWARPVAENIIYLVISPKTPVADANTDPRQIAPDYSYDTSRNGINLAQSPTDFQLPPLVEVTLVALDESSALRMDQMGGGSSALPTGLFNNASEENFRADLQSLETTLNEQRINYRIFTTTVPIRNSKWGL